MTPSIDIDGGQGSRQRRDRVRAGVASRGCVRAGVASRGCVRAGVGSGQGSRQGRGRVSSARSQSRPDREVDPIAKLTRSQSRPDRKADLIAKSTWSQSRPDRKADRIASVRGTASVRWSRQGSRQGRGRVRAGAASGQGSRQGRGRRGQRSTVPIHKTNSTVRRTPNITYCKCEPPEPTKPGESTR